MCLILLGNRDFAYDVEMGNYSVLSGWVLYAITSVLRRGRWRLEAVTLPALKGRKGRSTRNEALEAGKVKQTDGFPLAPPDRAEPCRPLEP